MTEIRLDDPTVTHFHIQGRQVWLKTDQYESVVRVPKAVRASFWTHGDRAVLRSGSVTVSGPHSTLVPLWDAVVDTTPTK